MSKPRPTAKNPETPHVCFLCGFKWQSLDADTWAKVEKAVKLNKTGPYCNLCFHLEWATRYATARGYKHLRDAVADFVIASGKHLESIK